MSMKRKLPKPHTPVRLDQRVFNLDPEKFALLQAMLDAPPRDNPKLRRLMATKAPWEA